MIGDFWKKLMQSGQLQLGDGHVEEFGVRMAFLPTRTIIQLVEMLYEEHGAAAFDMLFELGEAHGHYIIQSVAAEHKIVKKRFLDQMMDSANALGLGNVERERFSTDPGRLVFTITDSPFAAGCADSDVLSGLDRPVDDFLRGIGHGILEDMFDTPMESWEEDCVFQGDDRCRIIIEAAN